MLCLFSQHFPKLAASLLERGKKLKRSFREETVTDVLMANLVTLGGGSVIVEFPDEPTTGADMEWNFVNPDSRTSFQLLLQAKKITDKDPNWRKHFYKELFHRSGASKILQVETLCKTAGSRVSSYPLYIFYNPTNTCDLARLGGATNVDGVNLCNAHIVHWFAKTALSSIQKSQCRSLDSLQPFMFSLSSVLCPSNVLPMGPVAFAGWSIPVLLSFQKGIPILGRPIPPRPDQVRERLVQQQNQVRDLFTAHDLSVDLPEIPPVSDTIPDSIQGVIDRSLNPSPERRDRLTFWRVTFISQNPTDELGRPKESD